MPQTIIIESVTPADGVGTAGSTYWNRLADELGVFLPTTTTGVAAGGDPSRVVIADELRDDEMGYPFQPAWLYVRPTPAEGAVQRRIIAEPAVGYQGNQGVLTLSRPFAAPLTMGRSVVATAPLPMLRNLGVKGLRECSNEALARVWVVARVVVVGNGTQEYDLAALGVEYPEQVRAVEDACGGTWANLGAPYRVLVDGAQKTLVTQRSYGPDATFTLELFVRGDRLISEGGGPWTILPPNGQGGLQTETDQAAAPLDAVVALAMVKALEAHRRLLLIGDGMGPASAVAPDRQQRALLLDENMQRTRAYTRLAIKVKLDQLPRPVPDPQRGIVAGVAAPSGGWW